MKYIYSLKLCSLSYLNMFKDAENYLVASYFFFSFHVDTAQLRPLVWNNENVCFPRQKETNQTHHLPFWSSEPLIFLYVSMLSSYFFNCGALNIVTAMSVLKRVWPTCYITLDFLIQGFAINGAVFSTNADLFAEVLCHFNHSSCSTPVVSMLNGFKHCLSLLNAVKNMPFFFGLHRSQKRLIYSLACGFLHSVPVMLPEGLSSGRRTCEGENVSQACPKLAFSKWVSMTYFIFVDDAHFCHVNSEVVLVWHHDLDFLHLQR